MFEIANIETDKNMSSGKNPVMNFLAVESDPNDDERIRQRGTFSIGRYKNTKALRHGQWWHPRKAAD